MSSQPVNLFRRSWFSAIGGMTGLMLILALLSLTQLLGKEYVQNWQWLNWLDWSQSNLQSWAISLMVIFILPWMLLSFFGEWFYTRSFNRKQVFQMVWREYLKFWTAGVLLLIGLCVYSHFNHYQTGATMLFEIVVIAATGSLFSSLLLAATPAQLRRIWLPTGLFGLWWLGLADFQFLAWGQPAGTWLTWAGWLSLVGWTYAQVAHNQEDLGLDRPVSGEPEELGPLRQRLFQLLSLSSPATLRSYRGGSQLGARLGLLCEIPRMVYLQWLLLFAGLAMFISLLWIRYQVSFDHNQGLQLPQLVVLGIAWLILLMSNPRYLLSRRWELLASRPVNPWQVYLASWGLQALVLLMIASAGWLTLGLMPAGANFFNLGNVCLLMVFLLLGGELALGLFFLLLGFSVTLSPALLVGMLAVLHTADWPAAGLWAMVIAFRGWDLYRFRSQWEPAGTPAIFIQRQLVHYALPGILLLTVGLVGVQLQPLTRFLNLAGESGLTPRERMELSLIILATLYHQGEEPDPKAVRSAWTYQPAMIRQLLAQPRTPQAAYQMAQMLMTSALPLETLPGRYYSLNRFGFLPKDSYVWQEIHHEVQKISFWLDAAKGMPKADVLLIHSQLAELEQDYPKALKLAEQAQQLSADAHSGFQIAHLQKLMFRQSQALAAYQQLATRYPEQAWQAWFQAGTIAEEAGLSHQAVQFYLRAGDAAKNAKSKEAVLLRLLMTRFEQKGLCQDLNRVLKSTWLRDPRGFRNEQFLCQNQPEKSESSSLKKGLWYLSHHQPKAAVKEFAQTPAWLATAQLASGQKQQALVLARYQARPWVPETSDQALYFSTNKDDEQYLYHKVLLQGETKPSLDSGLHVLFRSAHPAADWPLLTKVFASRPADLARLTQFKRDLETLAQAFAKAGKLNATEHSSLVQTCIELNLSESLPLTLQTPELKAAVANLSKELLGR